MLKIKDNVDLEELEKFGFKVHHCKEWYYFDVDETTELFVKPISKQLVFKKFRTIGDTYINNITVLYDLIKADLVEKVDD